MQLSIDTHNKFTSKPTSGYASINANIVAGWQDINITDFADLISQGCSFSTGKFNTARKASQWQGQQCFAIDIDELTSPTPDKAIELIKQKFGVEPTLLYYSFSSNSENNKYRIVITSDSLITDAFDVLGILRGLCQMLKADSQCIDLARMFYGTTPNNIIHISNNIVNTSVLIEFGQEYRTNKTVEYEDVERREVSIADLTSDEVCLLLRHIKTKWNQILLGQDVSRYQSLKNVLLGTKDKQLYGFNYYPITSLDYMSVDLAVELVEQVVTGNKTLTRRYITEYDKDYLYITQQLARWAIA